MITFPVQDAIKQRLLGKPGHLGPSHGNEVVMAMCDSFRISQEGKDVVVRFYCGDTLVGVMRREVDLSRGDTLTISNLDIRALVKLT